MKPKNLFLLASLAALTTFFGVGHTQPPAAQPSDPAPEKATSPVVEMMSKDGRVEIKWKAKGMTCTATATQAVVKNGELLLTGTDKEPIKVVMKSKETNQAVPINEWVFESAATVKRVTISLKDGMPTFDDDERPRP
jgi:hypothetical protein